MRRKYYSRVLISVISILIFAVIGLTRARLEIENGTLTQPVIIGSVIVLILMIMSIMWGVNANITRYRRAARGMRSASTQAWVCMLEGGQYCQLLSADARHITVWKLNAKLAKQVDQWNMADVTVWQNEVQLAHGISEEGISISVNNQVQQRMVLYDPDKGRGMLLYPLKGPELDKAVLILQGFSSQR